MSEVEKRLELAGLNLPPAPLPGGMYTPVRPVGMRCAYLSGVACNLQGGETFEGKVGAELTLEQAEKAAEQCALNALAVLKANIGDLDRIASVVKLLGFVASANDFYAQPQVMNGASELLCLAFGDQIGKAARSAIGVNVLPGNVPVEIELIVELRD